MADILNSIIHSSDNAVNGLYNAMSVRRQKEQDTRAIEQNAYSRSRDQQGDKQYYFEQAAKIVGGRPENVQQGLDYLAMNGPPPDPRVGEMLVAYGQRLGGGKVFQPQRIINADGTESLILPDETGAAIPVGLPNGSRLAPQVNYVDAGNQRIPVTRSGVNPGLPAIPISPRPQDMPEFQYDVTAAREQAATDAIAPRAVVQAPADASVAGAVTAAQETARTESIPARTRAEVESAIMKTTATNQQEAVKSLPAAIDKGNQALAVIDGLINHDGLDYLVGVYSLAPIVPGSPQADADAYMKQIEGQAFLEAFSTLKGGGQITEVEGRKATEAILRLSRKQSKEAFTASLNELRGILQKGMERAEKAATPKDAVQSLQQNLGSKLDTSTEMSDEEYEAMKKRVLK